MDSAAKLLEKYLNAHLLVVLCVGVWALWFKAPMVVSEELLSKCLDLCIAFVGGGYLKDVLVAYINTRVKP